MAFWLVAGFHGENDDWPEPGARASGVLVELEGIEPSSAKR